MGFADYRFAIELRDLVRKIVRDEVDKVRPRYQMAVVQSIDRANNKCFVVYPGEAAPVPVNMGSIQPDSVGQVVRVEGVAGDRYVGDVMGVSFGGGGTGGEPPSGSASPGEVLFESFPGNNDDDKLDAACDYVKTLPRYPTIVLPGRDLNFNRTHYMFSGFRLRGPGQGWQNPEISGTSARLVPARVNLGTGIGIEDAALFVGQSTTYDVMFKGITFYGNGTQQVFHHDFDAAGSCYAGKFDCLTFHSIKHAMGSPAKGMSITLCHFTGEWTNVGVTDTQYTLRGSDNWLWTSGVVNYGWAGANGGKYLVRFDNLSKTFVANMYLTARGGSRCLIINGTASNQGSLIIKDCVFEGQNLNDPAMGSLIKHAGGFATIRDSAMNFYMADPSQYTDALDKAAVEVSGGVLQLDGIYSAKATGVSDSVPVVAVYKTGKARVRNWLGVKGSSTVPWAALPIVRQAFAGQAVVDDTLQLVLPDYLRRNTGTGTASANVTIANSDPGGDPWDEISAPSPAVVRYVAAGDAVIFQPGGGTDRSYVSWIDMEGANKKASLRSWFYLSGLPNSPMVYWQFRSPSSTSSYFGITIDNFGKIGWSNDIAVTSASVGTTTLATNTWYILHAEIDSGSTSSNGTIDVEVQDSTGTVIPGSSFSLTGQNIGGANADVIMGSVRFGRLGNYGVVPDFRMKNFGFRVNDNAPIGTP